ncbi:MAG: AAA family ATPase [Clostridia bacterium]|nr:AAA family ATPase [Clostridia bacterium]
MGIPILIIGKSGSGKSTSLRNFDEKELALINVIRKPLPFKKKFESTLNTDDYQTIAKNIVKTEKKSIVIDDAGYLVTNHFMNKHSSVGGGNAVFNLYNEIGDHFWRLIEFVKNKLEDDKIVYFIMHEEKDEFGDIKPKTIGKLLDDKVCIEGMFTIALRCMSDNSNHFFRTQSDGRDICKTPLGMFEDKEIDNDLKAVDTIIREYYELNKENK